MADLHVAAGAERNARVALVALAGHDDPGDAASELDRAIVTLADEGHSGHLGQLLAPAVGAALHGTVTYRVDSHERGTLEPTETEELHDVVAAVRRFLDVAEGLRGDESVMLFSAADGVERMVASALAEGPVRFHAPEHASFSGDQGAEAYASWDAQLARWSEAKAVPRASTAADSMAGDEWDGNRRAGDEGSQESDDPAALRARVVDLERKLTERDAELSRLRRELDRARDSAVDDAGSFPLRLSRRDGASRKLSRYRRSRTRPR